MSDGEGSGYVCNCGTTTKDHRGTCPLWFYPWAWTARQAERPAPTASAE